MNIVKIISDELGVRQSQTEAAVKLIDEGNTIPFIARYRKEATGALNDEQLRHLDERLRYLRSLEERKAAVIASIEEQGMLTEELKDKIDKASTLVAVEDLYRPYKPKKKTRASIARQKGLEGLAMIISLQRINRSIEEEALGFVSEEKGVADVKEAISGALDIIAENISDDAQYRTYIRNLSMKEGVISSQAKDKTAESVYEMYYDFEEPVNKIVGHRILALNRGEKEKVLTVKILPPVDKIIAYLDKQIITSDNKFTTPLLKEAIADSYDRLIAPSIERDIRNELTEKAEDGAITVFGKNLKQLLLQPPIAGHVVLGWDPAFRTGCKLAVVDPTGKVLETKVIFPTAPQNKVAEAKAELKRLIKKYNITLISLGNGTASRESEQVIVELIKELDTPLQYVIVSEAGASVYSASKLATEEFPSFDVGQRSAASIARRLQDPLSELVKIEPKAIGVGQYQHDMNQKKLDESLGGVVEDSVNMVGVDLNTASAALLEYVSGINKTLARNIVAYREANGKFITRADLLKVEKLGPKAFEQCAGFLRIPGGKNLLDNTGVHPESYEATRKLLELTDTDMGDKTKLGALWQDDKSVHRLAEELGIGELTLKDIIKELMKPGRDPREDMPKPILKSDVLDMKDLKPGMRLKGTVRNVIDFGAFVDIGVHQDGLVHISQITDRYIKHPLDALSIGDVVEVEVLSVDVKKKRISLTMKLK
ncbi:MAG: RNA-binding transcriptional accessory protein [Lachnospiraceae bacterium]|nr:RNA-binding transcriptional accessory protein [Lachnospiraceae bacterium]